MAEKKLSKAQIVGELLAEEQISAEEAITLLEPAQTIIYNVQIPEEELIGTVPLGNMWTTNITD
tara:strand:- start:393 stop:584 length:192 start_codon:yes stop_codon:yes gene_type:complete